MTDTRKISICIPTYNRVNMTLDSFKEVYDDERVSEIVIVDDESDLELFNQLKEVCDLLPKVKLYRNLTNQDCYKNKQTAISFSDNNTDGCILLDSDNVIRRDYLDSIYSIPEWDYETIYTPSFAYPCFDFRPYEGLTIDRHNVSKYIDKPMFEVMLNASNYFVQPIQYLEAWNGTVNPVTSDSIFQCYNWLMEGYKIYVVPGLQYHHRVHDGSHYRNNVGRTPEGFHENLLQKIRELK